METEAVNVGPVVATVSTCVLPVGRDRVDQGPFDDVPFTAVLLWPFALPSNAMHPAPRRRPQAQISHSVARNKIAIPAAIIA